MVLWEMLVIIITATVCLCFAASAVTDGILNAIDRYKSKRAARNSKIASELFTKFFEGFMPILESMKNDKKASEELEKEIGEFKKEHEEFEKKIRELK